MVLLDTDTLSLLFRSPEQYPELVKHLRQTPADDIYISAITVGEITEGALALVRKLQPKDQEEDGYLLLVDSLRYLNRFAILPYSAEAAALFRGFPAKARRLGRRDCQIAAIALLHEATIITRNKRHFSEIPGIHFEDWTL